MLAFVLWYLVKVCNYLYWFATEEGLPQALDALISKGFLPPISKQINSGQVNPRQMRWNHKSWSFMAFIHSFAFQHNTVPDYLAVNALYIVKCFANVKLHFLHSFYWKINMRIMLMLTELSLCSVPDLYKFNRGNMKIVSNEIEYIGNREVLLK